jgi:hypothetical protein
MRNKVPACLPKRQCFRATCGMPPLVRRARPRKHRTVPARGSGRGVDFGHALFYFNCLWVWSLALITAMHNYYTIRFRLHWVFTYSGPITGSQARNSL